MTDDIIVGIDLGTTNSAVAWITPEGLPEVLSNAEGQKTTPSIVQVRSDGLTLVGELAKREVVLEKENTAQFFKRDMGTSATYEYQGRPWTPVDLSAEVLKKLKADAESALGRPVRRAIITVPHYFQDAARVATQEAGRRAGLDVLEVFNEPTAAALTYRLRQNQRDETLLVYDLGGGTFDISLVQITPPDSIRVIGTDGNHHLGGKDWDDRLVEYACGQFRQRHRIDPLDDAYTFQEILIRAEEAKKALSASKRTVIPINCNGKADRIEVTRECFESLTCDLLTQTETLVGQVLSDAGYDYAKLDGVLMVGGSTRMPACIELVRKLTGRAPNTTVNPDQCVALGAALRGSDYGAPSRVSQIRGLARATRIGDVMSHSMGMIAVSADGEHYINSVLIPKNRPIPCREVRPYQVRTHASRDNLTSVYVTQGEGEDPMNCSFVGKYVIKGIPHGKKGITILDIAYEYDRSGIIGVSATQRGQNTELSSEKHPVPEDMSWLTKSPKEVSAVPHRTIYAAVDLSGSMSGQPLQDAKRAVTEFIGQCDLAHTSIGIMCFADSVRVDQSASQDARRLKQAVDGWRIGIVGGGNATHPFDEALAQLGSAGPRYLIVLTDGIWSGQGVAEARARECHKAGIEVIALGFGGADEAFLRRIATADQAALLSGSGELVGALGEIAQVLVEQGPERSTLGIRWNTKGR